MKFIKSIFLVSKRELYYQWHSKAIILLFLILLALGGLHLFGLYNNAVNAYNLYRRTEQWYIENNIDILEALGEPINRVVQGSSVTIDNPIRADFTNLAISIQNIMPQNVIGNFLEFIIFVFCTVIFGIYAGYIASYDYKFKTYKIVSTKYSQLYIIFGKILSIIFAMIITIGFTILAVFFGSFFVVNLISSYIPINEFTIDILNFEHGLYIQMLLSFFILVFYTIVGFSIAYISKTVITTTIILFLYGFIFPILGVYDFRNIFAYFAYEVFTFNARFVMVLPMQINVYLGVAIVIFTIVIALAVVLVAAKNRSAYN